jgi:hypothetical protein
MDTISKYLPVCALCRVQLFSMNRGAEGLSPKSPEDRKERKLQEALESIRVKWKIL